MGKIQLDTYLRALLISFLITNLLYVSGCGRYEEPAYTYGNPALVITNEQELKRKFSEKQVREIITEAEKYGSVHDFGAYLDDKYPRKKESLLKKRDKYIKTLDAWIEELYKAGEYSSILLVGGDNIIKMSTVKNPFGWLSEDKDTVYTDDVYGDMNHDKKLIIDVPIARIPDGNDFLTIMNQLRGTNDQDNGAFAVGTKDSGKGPNAIAKIIGADDFTTSPPEENMHPSEDLRYYFMDLHGNKTVTAWSGTEDHKTFVDTITIDNANAKGVIFCGACYGAWFFDENYQTDPALHLLRSGCRALVASTGLSYSASPKDLESSGEEQQESTYVSSTSGKLAKLFFENYKESGDALSAFYYAKNSFGSESKDDYDLKVLHEYMFFGVPSLQQAQEKAEKNVKQVSSASDTAFVMDVSGSMNDSMGSGTKLDAAKTAASSVINMIQLETTSQQVKHGAGLASFSDIGYLHSSLTSQFEWLQQKLRSYQPLSSTNIGAGLEKGLSILSGSGSKQKVIILLSDGQTNTGMTPDEIISGPVKTASEQGIVIYTIGFGEHGALDEDLLRRIAQKTGGLYYYANEAFKLENVYVKLRHQSTGDLLADYSGSVSSVQKEAGSFDIESSGQELRGTINWENNPAELLLKDPEGMTVDTEYPGVDIYQQSKPNYFIIKNPRPGTWTTYVKAKQDGSSNYNIIISSRKAKYYLEIYPIILLIVFSISALIGMMFILVFHRPYRLKTICDQCDVGNIRSNQFCENCGKELKG